MKTQIKLIIVITLLGLCLAALSPLLGSARVSAAPLFQGSQPPDGVVSPTPAPDETQETDRLGLRRQALERIFARQQDWLDRQSANLDRTGQVNERVEALIARIEEQGLDPVPIVQALQAFNSAAASARVDHLKAKAILTIHAGFNDRGQVINLREAAQTVRTAGSTLHSAARTLRSATRELAQAIRDFRQAHKDAILPSPDVSQ